MLSNNDEAYVHILKSIWFDSMFSESKVFLWERRMAWISWILTALVLTVSWPSKPMLFLTNGLGSWRSASLSRRALVRLLCLSRFGLHPGEEDRAWTSDGTECFGSPSIFAQNSGRTWRSWRGYPTCIWFKIQHSYCRTRWTTAVSVHKLFCTSHFARASGWSEGFPSHHDRKWSQPKAWKGFGFCLGRSQGWAWRAGAGEGWQIQKA